MKFVHIIGSFIILLTIAATVLTHPVMGQTETVPTPTDKTQQLEDLKERLATKVAELRQTQRKAIMGIVDEIRISSLTLTTQTKNLKVDLVDEIPVIQYLKGVRTKLSLDDIDIDDRIVIFGEYDTAVDLIKPNVIVIQNTQTTVTQGTITEIVPDDFTFTLRTTTSQEYTVDIEKTTRTVAWTADKGVVKSGFSKLTVGEPVHVVGTAGDDDEYRLKGITILHLTSTGKSEEVSPTPTIEPTQTVENQ